ncbi:hypothetical protein [Hymenobacter arizonensis]|uniref:SMI1 / KNR4 family (SUKH-1) n=1 Tax=Hymenobacter arizonensis TaxID=1227077 RepID=A0A1I6BMU5_HYMAR|nr:hypothetical protein [Hymenobacter arizonensis]SFQ82235.1 hypothetical protein SAMN04515668_4767 [Hymenobacter arizonensis]
MTLLSLADYGQYLKKEFAGVEPALVDDLLLRAAELPATEVPQVERLLNLGPFPRSFTDLLRTHDFSCFSINNAQFGGARTGSLAWLLEKNDATAFGFESFLQAVHRQGFILLANGDPFAFFLHVPTGHVTALTDELPLADMLPVAVSFQHFLQGMGTAYWAKRTQAVTEFRELARREFGEAAYPFWHDLTV